MLLKEIEGKKSVKTVLSDLVVAPRFRRDSKRFSQPYSCLVPPFSPKMFLPRTSTAELIRTTAELEML